MVVEDQAREHLYKLDLPKSMGPEWIQLQALQELTNVIARPLLITFEGWQSGDVSKDWKKANVTD